MRVEIPERTLHQSLGEEVVLLGLDSGVYYALDPVGARIWELLVRHGSTEAVLDRLVAEYDAPEERLRQDLETLVHELAERNLVVLGA